MTHVAFEGFIEFGRVGGEAGHVLGGPKAPDEAGGVPGCTAGQCVALQKDDVGPAQFGEVVGDAGAHYAATDDHDLRPLGDLLCHV